MPIYEYECPKCGVKEVWEKISDNPDGKPVKCDSPGCTSKMSRKISASAFHLKGSGWYKTDYASSNGSSAKSSSSKSESKTESKSETKSETKSDKGSTKPSGGGGCGSGCNCH